METKQGIKCSTSPSCGGYTASPVDILDSMVCYFVNLASLERVKSSQSERFAQIFMNINF